MSWESGFVTREACGPVFIVLSPAGGQKMSYGGTEEICLIRFWSRSVKALVSWSMSNLSEYADVVTTTFLVLGGYSLEIFPENLLDESP